MYYDYLSIIEQNKTSLQMIEIMEYPASLSQCFMKISKIKYSEMIR